MKVYNEIITRSLIDFEEIKYVLANANIKLISSNQVKERYFLSTSINLQTSNYDKILSNSYTIVESGSKKYLSYKTKKGSEVNISQMEILNERDCMDFLSHIGFQETFNIEKNLYEYSDGKNFLSIINMMNIGTFMNIKKENSTKEQLCKILSSFNIPYNENECNEAIEKVVISKIRRNGK